MAFALLLAVFPAGARATNSAAQELANRYSPVLSVEPQAKPCGKGEAYRPTSVDTVLGKQGVTLRSPNGRVITEAPTSSDLFGLGDGYYLDLPGNPLNPGCGYERQFRRWNGGGPALVYAHVADDPAQRGKLAVQYWFFYTFNDFTDKHEGDWEMAQVDFDASTPQEALAKAPYQVDLSQHAGGERTGWNDQPLEKSGTHPVVYIATGSHALYFSGATFLGRGAQEGFGCDYTGKATERVPVKTVLLPEVPSSAASPFAWLAFHGRWGQKEKGINNGPTGPAAKNAWSQPIEWADGLRTGSVKVPTFRTLGPSVTTAFCNAVTASAVALNWGVVHPLPLLGLLLIAMLGVALSARRTRWRPSNPAPVRGERQAGQILRVSPRLYWRDLRTFVMLGLAFIPFSLLAATVQWVLVHQTGFKLFVALDGRGGAITALLTILIGDVAAAFAAVIVTAAVAVALNELDSGRVMSPPAAFGVALRRLRPLAAATVLQLGTALVLTLTVVGIPFAIHRFICWSLYTQECVLHGGSGRESLRRSGELIRGRWWRTFGFTALVDLLAILSGPVLGIGLLLVTSHSLNFIDIEGSLIYALSVPFAAIALTLYFFNLEASPAMVSSERSARTRGLRLR